MPTENKIMSFFQDIMIYNIILIIFTLLPVIECERNSDSTEKNKVPKFQEVFSAHKQWEGHYVYNNTPYYSMLIVHSGYKTDNPGVIATFKDVLGATFDVKGEQEGENEFRVVFKAETMFKHLGRFPKNFTFVGTLALQSGVWQFEGLVSVPDNGPFGLFSYTPTDGKGGPYFDDDSSLAWRYTLIIGVPIFLGLVGVAGTVAIVYWAIKKGYIRHVPKSYDSFDNPVQYDNNKQTVHM